MNVKKRRFYIDVLILMEQLYSFDKSRCNVGDLMSSFGYHKIAIYGMGEVGHLLLNMLDGTEIQVPYVIDNNVKVELDSIGQITEEELYCIRDIDVVIVTPLVDYSFLEKRICQNCDFPVMGMAEIIEMLLEKSREKRKLV